MSGLQQAVDKLGSQAELAAAIGLKQQNIWNWLNRGSGEAPPEHCSAIERATGGAVMRWHLRPSDWWRIWPELRGKKGAPAVPKSEAA